MAKLNHRSAWLLRHAYSRRPHLLCTFHHLPVDAPPGISMSTVRGLEKAKLIRQTKTPSLFEVTEEGELWIQDHPEET